MDVSSPLQFDSLDNNVGSAFDVSSVLQKGDAGGDDDDDDQMDTTFNQKIPLKEKVASPMLMPPPTIVPAIKQKVYSTKIFGSQKVTQGITKPVQEVLLGFDLNGTDHRKLRCFVPTKDVRCYITKDVADLDITTKKMVLSQIGNKIFKKPNIRLTPNKQANSFGESHITNSSNKNSIKIDTKHFATKNKSVGDLDIESLPTPIRCSMPTPSTDGSTILVGHLDFSLGPDESELNSKCEDEFEETEDDADEGDDDADDDDNDDDEMFKEFINTPTRMNTVKHKKIYNEKEDIELHRKNMLCSKWMQNETGISTNNNDVAPSLYEPSVTLSGSLLDVTSVSHNIPTPQKNLSSRKVLAQKLLINTRILFSCKFVNILYCYFEILLNGR